MSVLTGGRLTGGGGGGLALPLSIAQGGTGATTVAAALAALGLPAPVRLFRQSTSSTTIALTTDGLGPGASNQALVPANDMLSGLLMIQAYQSAGSAGTLGDSAFWWMFCQWQRRGAGTTALVSNQLITSGANGAYTAQPNTAGIIAMSPSSASNNGALASVSTGAGQLRVTLAADTGNDAARVNCAGISNGTFDWTAILWKLK